MTDMVGVWTCRPEEDDVATAAAEANISDFSPEKLRLLVLLFEALFATPQLKLALTENGTEISIVTDISDVLKWQFHLKRLSSEAELDFFASLCLQSYHTHSFLKHLALKLESTIRIQQKYILYLEENYKTVNGSELMEKYKRQHPEDARDLEEFSRDEFMAACRKEYVPAEDKWALIEDATKDAVVWKTPDVCKREIRGISNLMTLGEKTRIRPKLEALDEVQHKKTKREVLNPPSSPTKQYTSSPVKLEGSSPRRRRIGRIGRR